MPYGDGDRAGPRLPVAGQTTWPEQPAACSALAPSDGPLRAGGVRPDTASAFSAVAYVTGRWDFAEYLELPNVINSGELSVFGAAMMGSCLGFLWFNCHPAQIFMGDSGSLPLGGALATIALVTKQECMLLLVGGVFVIEALSVIIQVISYKVRKKRVFRMAPIHHHFELKGWAEPKIIVRFWIIAMILGLVAISTLKLR